MKKILLGIALVMGVSLSTFAQVGAGKMFAGGGLGFNRSRFIEKDGNTTTKAYPITTIFLNPGIGYFVGDDMAMGARLNLSVTRSSADQPLNPLDPTDLTRVKTNLWEMGLNVFARKYFNFNEGFYGFVEGGLIVGRGFTSTVVDGTRARSDAKNNRLSAYISPGFAYFPSEKYSFELQFNLLDITRTSVVNKAADPQTRDFTNNVNFGFNSFAPVSLGFNYFF